jgi:hypothetical protein
MIVVEGMNVGQLIQKLKKYPSNWKVMMVDTDGCYADDEINVVKGDQEKKIVRLAYGKMKEG